MITDIFGSLKDNVIRKVRNPFFGTFTIVFVLKNWKLFYSLLFFDAYENRESRIDFIERYIADAGGAIWMFVWAALCTLGILIITYFLLNVGALISHFSESRVSPWVIKMATRGAKIVTKENYDRLERQYHRTNNKLQVERNKRAEAEAEREKIEKKFAEFRTEIGSSLSDILDTNKNQDDSFKTREEKIVDRIFKEDWDKDFNACISILRRSAWSRLRINNGEMEKYLIYQNVIAKNTDKYALTEFGREVMEIFLNRIA